MARTSACALGSNSCLTAFNAWRSSFPVRVSTMEAPNDRGLAVLRLRAVNAASAAIRSRSTVEPELRFFCPLRRREEEETTPMLEISMATSPCASRKSGAEAPACRPGAGWEFSFHRMITFIPRDQCLPVEVNLAINQVSSARCNPSRGHFRARSRRVPSQFVCVQQWFDPSSPSARLVSAA